MSVLTHLKSVSSNLVLSAGEKDSIATSISTLHGRADDYFADDLTAHVQFGSSTRGTQLPRKADARSDVDYMLVFDNEEDLKPQTFLDRIRRFVTKKYKTSEVHQSHPTVILLLGHIWFDLVPAYRSWWGQLYIPAPSSNFADWMTTDPTGFNSELQTANKKELYQLLPMIRLMKYWNATNGYVFESFALEQELASRAYWLCTNLKEYFYSGVNSLNAGIFAPQWKRDKVNRAKKLVAAAKELEADGYPYLAEAEIEKLVPSL